MDGRGQFFGTSPKGMLVMIPPALVFLVPWAIMRRDMWMRLEVTPRLGHVRRAEIVER